MRHGGSRALAGDRAGPAEERSLTGSSQFRGSFPRADVVLNPPHPEIAFVGRSNVGKSSLLNALVGERLARVSATPGKTRALNVYEVSFTPPSGRGRPRPFYVLDLPGYGYARASHAERAAHQGLLSATLGRPTLGGVVWLLDSRRTLSADDHAMLAWFGQHGVRVLAALTKADTLARSARVERERAIRGELGVDPDQVLLTSARTGEGIRDLRAAVSGLVAGLKR